jgi:predicted ribosome quality control (RQC) complex YloA/Tae2 family protein
MQTVDYTTLTAICFSLGSDWVPSRLEQVYQLDPYTISLCLRTLTQKRWLTISWHSQGARICLGNPPPRIPDTFTFSEQLRHLLNGYALTEIKEISPWERVLDLHFAQRPGEDCLYHLYVEIMGKYSNVILTDAKKQIITVAHQVTANKSSVRTIETGQPYQLPPPLSGYIPKLSESLVSWRERVSLIPGRIDKQLVKTYRGLSPVIVAEMLSQANLNPRQSVTDLTLQDWSNLFQSWQKWLKVVTSKTFKPGWTKSGYTVLGWEAREEVPDLHNLLDIYYTNQLQQENFHQLYHQLRQRIANILKKLKSKAEIYGKRLEQSHNAPEYRQKADLLMANLHQWQPGMESITLKDFATDKPITIKLEPENNAIQNAQKIYKQHQKLKRAKNSVEPLLLEVNQEIEYLEQVQTSLTQLDSYVNQEDWQTLREIQEELISQKYIKDNQYRKSSPKQESQPHRYQSPSGFEVLIGRNNRQNDQLTFRVASDYDLWFHTQEIPGSHVLLRLPPGEVPQQGDLDFVADLTAYYSQARESEQVAVIYTEPKNVYKPKGAKPGMSIYKKETVLWGKPQQAKSYLNS